MTKGRCLCGEVEFEVRGELQHMTHCHCSMCRKAHGALFATYASVAKENFSWIKGESQISSYQSSPHSTRCFCTTCGAVVPGSFDDEMSVPVGMLDDGINERPQAHIFVASKAEGYEIVDDLPQFDAYPPGYGDEVDVAEPPAAQAGSVSGGCLCGAVTFEYSGTPEFMMNCHCSRCRRVKGAAHASNVFVKAENLTWKSGRDNIAEYKVPEAARFGHAFCTTCGSSVPRQAAGTPVYNVPAGSLNSAPGVQPKAHIFMGSKSEWYDPADDLPRFEEMPTG